MKVRCFTSLVLACVVSGCSFYDVAANTVDAAFGTGIFSNENRNDDDWDGFWNPETSACIRHEKEHRELSRQLDAVEEGKDFVILPTGEKYPVNQRSVSDESMSGPTATCLSRSSD